MKVVLTGDDTINIPQEPTIWMQNIVVNAGKKGVYNIFFIAYDVEPENKIFFLEQIMMEYAMEFGII